MIIAPWNYERRADSLKFFAGLGNRQVIAGYYDSAPAQITNWLEAARPYSGISGVIYTTWQNRYSDLEAFGQILANYPAPAIWSAPRIEASITTNRAQLVLEGERGRQYEIDQSTDLVNWNIWTNLTATDATVTLGLSPSSPAEVGRFFRGAAVP
jgi:hypothetical protein